MAFQTKDQGNKNNAFEDFFECSEIDNQDYSEFINDQSQFIIGQNGNNGDDADACGEYGERISRPQTQTNIHNSQGVDIDVNNIISLIREEDRMIQQEQLQLYKQQSMELQQNHIKLEDQANTPDNYQTNNNYQDDGSKPTNYQTNSINAIDQQQPRKSRKIITKETMMQEPLPLFDCMFCVKQSKKVFQKISERALEKKYCKMQKQKQDHKAGSQISVIIQRLEENYSSKSIEQFLNIDSKSEEIIIDEQGKDEVQYYQDSLSLQVMIQNLPLHVISQLSHNQSIGNGSPLALQELNNKSLQTMQTNISQFIMMPSIKVSHQALDQKGKYLKNKLSSMIMQSRLKQNYSLAIGYGDRNNLVSSPLLTGQDNQHQNTLMFNTVHGGMTKPKHDNMIVKEFIIEEGNQYFEENVNIERWARTHRQKLLINISFESDFHNIYNPVFTSDNSSSRSLSSLERSIYHDYIPISINKASDDDHDDINSESSNPSVAEERDTITITPNAVTPNLSRIMNICSISKIEQPSLITADSEFAQVLYKAPKSQLSHNKTKPKKVHLFQRHTQSRGEYNNRYVLGINSNIGSGHGHQRSLINNHDYPQTNNNNNLIPSQNDHPNQTPVVECLLLQDHHQPSPLRFKQSTHTGVKSQTSTTKYKNHQKNTNKGGSRMNHEFQQQKYQSKMQLSQNMSSSENLPNSTLFGKINSQGRNVSNIIMSQNHIKQPLSIYKTEPNDSFLVGTIQNTLPLHDYQNAEKSSPVKILHRIKTVTKSTHLKHTYAQQKHPSQKQKLSMDLRASTNLKQKSQQQQQQIDENAEQQMTNQMLHRNSSNQLLHLEQSTIINPYETLYNSPNQYNNFMDKSTTIGGENRTSLLTTGATEIRMMQQQQQDKSRRSNFSNVNNNGGKKSAASMLRNSQSMSNLNLQPRAFITRNVKMRKNNNQSTFAFGSSHPTHPQSDFLTTPQNHVTRRQIDDKLQEQLLMSRDTQNSYQQQLQQNGNNNWQESQMSQMMQQQQTIVVSQGSQSPQGRKDHHNQQLKRQRLARDILLSKVYNSSSSNTNQPPQAISSTTHKKTNTTLNGGNSGQQHQGYFNQYNGGKSTITLGAQKSGVISVSVANLNHNKHSYAQLKSNLKKSLNFGNRHTKVEQPIIVNNNNNETQMSTSNYFNKQPATLNANDAKIYTKGAGNKASVRNTLTIQSSDSKVGLLTSQLMRRSGMTNSKQMSTTNNNQQSSQNIYLNNNLPVLNNFIQ